MLMLHSFWLSIATYRVRIALDLKAGAVPALEGATRPPITQSLSMLEWLEETCPTPALLLSRGGAA